MFVLFETAAGNALFKLEDDAVFRSSDDPDIESEFVIKSLVKLKAFFRFPDTAASLAGTITLLEGKASSDLCEFLLKHMSPQEKVAVADIKLGLSIREKTGIQYVQNPIVANILRGIRCNIESLLEDEHDTLIVSSFSAMVLGLAHSLSRYKVKFSPEKDDTMIVQAISLSDELDKDINIYATSIRKMFRLHFPELSGIVPNNVEYIRVVNKMGSRSNATNIDHTDILTKELEVEVQQAAIVSVGSEISQQDVDNIRSLSSLVLDLADYRYKLYEYMKNRMFKIAPNLTAMVGCLIGARLISHAGSLRSLAKYPASTLQIAGAEKALFSALKNNHSTPKYGLIYYASVVHDALPENKGKVARKLAAKLSLAIRVDAFRETNLDDSVGEGFRQAVEKQHQYLKNRVSSSMSGFCQDVTLISEQKRSRGTCKHQNAGEKLKSKLGVGTNPSESGVGPVDDSIGKNDIGVNNTAMSREQSIDVLYNHMSSSLSRLHLNESEMSKEKDTESREC